MLVQGFFLKHGLKIQVQTESENVTIHQDFWRLALQRPLQLNLSFQSFALALWLTSPLFL